MPNYLTPGVYIEEIPSGSKPIEGVATSVTALVGAASRGPIGEAILIQSFDDYQQHFGPIADKNDALGLAVNAFYLNGGGSAYVARLVNAGAPVTAASLILKKGQAHRLVVTAKSPGEWANSYRVRFIKPATTPNHFNLEIGKLVDGSFKALEILKGLDLNPASPNYAVTRTAAESSLVTLTTKYDKTGNNSPLTNGKLVGEAVDQAATFFNDNVKDAMFFVLNLDGLGPKKITLPAKNAYQLAGANNGDGIKVAAEIKKAVRAVDPANEPFKSFDCTYNAQHKFTLTSGSKSEGSSVQVYRGDGGDKDIATLLKLAGSGAEATPGYVGAFPDENGISGEELTQGAATAPIASDYRNFYEQKLIKKRDVSIILLPGQWLAKDGSGNPVIDATIAHCEATQSRVLILDPPPGHELSDASMVEAMVPPSSSYTVMYYPWIQTVNPAGGSERITTAPSAYAAGLWARTDNERGVWKAPAGTTADLRGVAKLEYDVGDGEQAQLNPNGVNALRQIPGAGHVVWGARTLATKADPEWRYVPVRRLAIFIEQSLFNGTQWAVFEPNNHVLWGALRANIEAFMNGVWRSGGLQGNKTSEAYFVNCGLGTTMTQADIDAGRVIVQVGFAPLKPAEFVIIRIEQLTGKE